MHSQKGAPDKKGHPENEKSNLPKFLLQIINRLLAAGNDLK